MPTANIEYNIDSFDRVNSQTDILNGDLEILINGENKKLGAPLLIQTAFANAPAPTMVHSFTARTYDANAAGYVTGDDTLVSLSSKLKLVHLMTAIVAKPQSKEYRLIADTQGTFLAYKDSTYTGNLIQCKWVEINSDEDKVRDFAAFNPSADKYTAGNVVKYLANGQYRLFAARVDIIKSTFNPALIPAPTGLRTDNYWSLVNSESAPNYSLLGQLETRFYYNSERDGYPCDTVEDLIARETAGASILYLGRTLTVELGTAKGNYVVVYDTATTQFNAFSDGSLQQFVPASFKKVIIGAGDDTLDIPVITENIGSFHSGDSFSGTLQEAITKMLVTYQAPSFTDFTFNGYHSGNVLAGMNFNTGNYEFKWSTKNQINVKPNSLVIQDVTANDNLAVSLANDGSEILNVVGFTLDKGTNHNFKIIGFDTDNNVFNADLSLTGVLARAYNALSITPAQLKANLTAASANNFPALGFKQDLDTSIGNNMTLDCTGGKYIYFVYDAALPDPSLVFSGQNTFSAYTIDVINLKDQFGISRSYKVLYTGIQYGMAVNVNVVR